MQAYLESSQYIDWSSPAIADKANELAIGAESQTALARRCFEFVRDEIKHSWDHRQNPVTCVASDVLRYRTGYCYAKSHLLAALLRANSIPAGLCYQRLILEPGSRQFCLHGLNVIFLEKVGWYRVDPRGNKTGVNAIFSPPQEQLAFPICTKGEIDFPEIWAEPHPAVVNVLTQFDTVEAVYEHLPDIQTC